VSLGHVSAKGCYKAPGSGRLWSSGVALSWPLELILVPWRPQSLSPGLSVAAAAFLFEGSASSKAECVSQRHAPTHTGTLPWLATMTTTEWALPLTIPEYGTVKTHVKHKYGYPSL